MDGIENVNTSSKSKLFLILGLLAILVALAYLVFINKARSYEIRGSIIERKENSIVVKGIVKRSDQQASEEKEISAEIFLTPETHYQNKVLILPENYRDGPFTPKEEKRDGSAADLTLGRPVIITAKADSGNKFTVLVIQYNSMQR